MPNNPPPEPPLIIEHPAKPSGPIVDMRDVFARKTPQTKDDRARAITYFMAPPYALNQAGSKF